MLTALAALLVTAVGIILALLARGVLAALTLVLLAALLTATLVLATLVLLALILVHRSLLGILPSPLY
jgi:hypothetical protein